MQEKEERRHTPELKAPHRDERVACSNSSSRGSRNQGGWVAAQNGSQCFLNKMMHSIFLTLMKATALLVIQLKKHSLILAL